jgi:hypothetical protein
MAKSKYHVRVMRPTFERAILTVEASSEKAAVRAALDEAGRLTDDQWGCLETVQEPPVVELAVSQEDAQDSDAAIVAFLRNVQHAYALFRANLADCGGDFIVPSWLRHHSALAIADITHDWSDALFGIHEEGVEAFISWLGRQTRPANLANFLAERDKRRENLRERPDER